MRALIAGAILLVLTSCHKKEPQRFTCTGQAFLALANRETVRLSGMVIKFYDSNAMHAVIADRVFQERLRRNERMSSMAGEARKASDLITDAETRLSGAESNRAQLDILRQRMSDWQDQAASRPVRVPNEFRNASVRLAFIESLIGSNASAINAIKMQRAKSAKDFENATDAMARLETTDDRTFLNEAMDSFLLREPVAEVFTDADGKFTAKLPVGTNYLALAKAERTSLAGEERMFWAVPVPMNAPLLLHNANAFKSAEW